MIRPAVEEMVALERAHGRVLRENVSASDPVPPFDNSAMDGYGVIAADLASASESAPATLRLAGEVVAGDSGAGVVLEPGATVRILTGAPIPRGVEAVVPHELTERDGESVRFFAPVAPGKNIRRAGCDMQAGDVVLESGRALTSGRIAIAAALGRSLLRATRPVRGRVIASGRQP